jgi:hypothetical protein
VVQYLRNPAYVGASSFLLSAMVVSCTFITDIMSFVNGGETAILL